MIRALKAFVLGIREHKRSLVTHVGYDLIAAYDRGRHLANAITGRL